MSLHALVLKCTDLFCVFVGHGGGHSNAADVIITRGDGKDCHRLHAVNVTRGRRRATSLILRNQR